MFHLVNGVVHGVTNMGEILLPIFSNLKNPTKHSVNYNAYFYSLYVFIQIIWLIIFGKFDYIINGVFYTPIALLVYFIFGKQTLNKINNKTYNNLTTIFFWSLTFSVGFKLINLFIEYLTLILFLRAIISPIRPKKKDCIPTIKSKIPKKNNGLIPI